MVGLERRLASSEGSSGDCAEGDTASFSASTCSLSLLAVGKKKHKRPFCKYEEISQNSLSNKSNCDKNQHGTLDKQVSGIFKKKIKKITISYCKSMNKNWSCTPLTAQILNSKYKDLQVLYQIQSPIYKIRIQIARCVNKLVVYTAR